MIRGAVLAILAILALMAVALTPAPARADWWQTPAVRACCSDADAVYADDWRILPDGRVMAVVTGTGPRNHSWAPIGRVYEVPADRILREPGNPTGRALLFLNQWTLALYCFAMGAGG